MKDLFITKAGILYPLTGTASTTKCTGLWDSNLLAAGGLGFYNQDGSIIGATTDVNADIASTDVTGDYVVVQGITTDGVKTSIKIDRSGFDYNYKVYNAPVAAVKFLGSNILTSATAEKGNLNLPSSLSVGDVVGVTLVDKTKESWENNAKTYDFIVTSGDLLTGVTAKNIIAKLVVEINNDSLKVATALAVTDGTNNDGIKFTGTTAGSDFTIAIVDGVLKDADICEYNIVNNTYTASVTNAIAIEKGSGTYAQILDLEETSSLRSGNINSMVDKARMYSAASNIVLAETYDMYYMTFRPAIDDSFHTEPNVIITIGIAVPNGETATNEMKDALDAILPLIAS